MLSHNYDVAGQNARSEVMSHGGDLYKQTFGDPNQGNYIWSDRAQSLSEILSEATLPLVVKLCNNSIVSDNETPVDLRRPLLLFKEVKGKKLHARNIKPRQAIRDPGRIVYHAVGPYVTIPDSFQGFFKMIDAKDQPLNLIADVGRLMSRSFISAEPCHGYVCVSHLKDPLYQKTTIPPGLYFSNNILEGTVTYLNKRKSEKKKLMRCLNCDDERGKTVLFPMEAKGKFYISELNAKFSRHFNIDSGCRAYRWMEYNANSIKGLRVRMMHGQAPQQECQFTGLLEFSHATEEHTVIGSTMTSSPRLFEMAVTSEPFFIVALNSDNMSSGTLQQQCLRFARTECENYLQAIKVKKDYDIDHTPESQ